MEQIDPLAPSPCAYGQAGERICGGSYFQPAWCCGGRFGPVVDPEMST